MLRVSGHRIAAGDGNLTAATAPRATDQVVRDYTDWVEANTHAAGTTDHIGNLPGPASQGTWVRFADQHLNILGEDHTAVAYPQVHTAVGAGSFIYEPFAGEVIPPGSHLLAAYEAENHAEMVALGILAAPNRHLYGGESIYPKIGFIMVAVAGVLGTPGMIPFLRQMYGYTGKAFQRYVKIGWALAKDVAAGHPATAAETALAQAVAAHTGALDPYLTGLVVDGWLGDTLDTPAGRLHVPRIVAFGNALVAVLHERAGHDQALGVPERQRLAGLPFANDQDKVALFGLWRDLHFQRCVHAAHARGVRYAAMGSKHLDFLLAAPGRLPANAHTYYMDGPDLTGFEAATAGYVK